MAAVDRGLPGRQDSTLAKARRATSAPSRNKSGGPAAMAVPARSFCRCFRSKPSDFDLAEHHHAFAELQRDPSFRKLGVLGAVHRLHAVERDGELRALGDDMVLVPLAAGLEHLLGLGGVDDGAGAVTR